MASAVQGTPDGADAASGAAIVVNAVVVRDITGREVVGGISGRYTRMQGSCDA